jgi:3-deoxy-D-manno-octulosonic-acid transferase
MIRFLYNLLFPIALLFFLPSYIGKMLRRGNYSHKFGQRLGFYDRDVRQSLSSHRWTWIHAVSVGEVMIALKLATKLKEREPDLRVALTTTTTTGFALASKQASQWMQVMYNPLDFWPIMRRVFALIRPARVILVEAEVWPNLAAIAHARSVPLALVNARLSPRSERRFARFKIFVAPIFRLLDLVCVQEFEDIARWQTLGVARAHIRHVGSIKFDTEEIEVRPEMTREILTVFEIDSARPILLGGSTHPGEEEILAEVYLKLRIQFPTLLLIIAPRHVERTRDISAKLRQLGLRITLRSDAMPVASTDCLLLDTTGELRDWYSVATVVFIGKSLSARGGQNPIEPIVAGKPVIFGPHKEIFAALARSLIAPEGAMQITTAVGLEEKIAALIANEALRDRLVGNARRVVAEHRGATARVAELLLQLGSQTRGRAAEQTS